MRADHQFAQLMGPVKAALSGTLPGDAVYDLHLPLNCGLGKKSAGLREAQGALMRRGRAMAERLTDGDPDTCSVVRLPQRGYSRVTGKPTSFPFPYEINLHRWARSRCTQCEPGALDVARVAPEDLGSAREERLRKALEDKCPKLERCRQEGARTVLALESGDLPVSNSVLIGEALARALHGREDAPDEVYLVETVSDL